MIKKLILVLKVAFSISIIVFIFYKYINIDDFIYSMQNIDYLVLPILLLSGYVTKILLAYQMKVSLISFNIKTSTHEIFKIHLISAFYSLLLPSDIIAGGITWHLLSKDNNKRAEVASILVYLRILNLITLIPFALLGIYFEPKLIEYNIQLYILIFGFLLLIILSPFFWDKSAKLSKSILNYLILLLPSQKLSKRCREANDNLWNSVKISREMPFSFNMIIIGLSFLFQFLVIIFTYFIMELLNIHIPVFAVAWIITLLAIIQFIPITIGGFGLREFSLIIILKEFYSIAPELSLLFATVIVFSMLFFNFAWGGYYALTYQSKKTANQ